MKLPEYAPSTSDRVSTRQELFEVLEVLGAFEESRRIELASESDLLACLEAESGVFPAETPDELSVSEEQSLMEAETFDSLLGRKAERIN